VKMTDGLGTLYRQRMIIMMFIGMDVPPDIVRRNAHRTGTVTVFRSVVRYRPSQILLSLTTYTS
jgi:hypothetical protein